MHLWSFWWQLGSYHGLVFDGRLNPASVFERQVFKTLLHLSNYAWRLIHASLIYDWLNYTWSFRMFFLSLSLLTDIHTLILCGWCST